jgi:hypothetical protein
MSRVRWTHTVMDTKMLARGLDERPNIVRKLVEKDDDEITTERKIEYLERLLRHNM